MNYTSIKSWILYPLTTTTFNYNDCYSALYIKDIFSFKYMDGPSSGTNLTSITVKFPRDHGKCQEPFIQS